VFRRRGTEAPDVLDQASPDDPDTGEPAARPGLTPAKGRPTPKRSQAERQRRQPYTAPTDRKAAATQGRAQGKTDRARRMEAMRRGEDWALPRKDQGPVRALARDVVDARRGISEFYLYGIVFLIAALFLPALRKTLAVDYIILLILAIIVIEGWYVSNKVLRLARDRFPGQSTKGIRVYTALRGTQIRKMRVPAPRVQRGTKV
jgi:hypothetical protein